MVKVSLKGGVWKNSEDEILKAAVQKYGKQQWARVASLLNRKSAKQAKARWHEWLDPSIKKTEWSRAEEEKLLHLAKLMPAQWKTIGPIVGRTATQCQEHYERLLDQAAAGGDGKPAATDTLRQHTALRPGQIDAHPETRPAKPDPIDMDEDEMEMLQEARARLANTVGKKAKRKQREKMLAQAKRLADLQKRRELKQAGLLSAAARKKSSTRSKEIDLGVEIPFFKAAPAGFHATDTEDKRAASLRQKRLKAVDFHQVNEAQYRTRDREAAAIQKREQARLRVLEQSTEKYAQQQKDLEEERQPARPRVGLSLPEPSIDEAEWQTWHKESQKKLKQPPASNIATGETGVTAALLGDYTDRPLPTPLRTPAATATASRMNLTETATALRKLERGQTPLLTTATTEDGDEGDTEQAQNDATPAARPTVDRSVANRTPSRRDALGLYASAVDDGASVGASTFASSRYVSDDDEIRRQAREERRALKAARQQIEAALAALPAPQFEYELAAPAVETVEDDEDDMVVAATSKRPLDQADVEAAERNAKRRKAEREWQARSTVLKRPDLPRPGAIDPSAVVVESSKYAEAAKLVQTEMLCLLQYDAYTHPIAMNSKDRGAATMAPPTAVTLESIDLEALQAARTLLEAESASNALEGAEYILRVLEEGETDLAFVNEQWQEATNKADRVDSLKAQFAALETATKEMRKANDKVENKLSVAHGGYSKRSRALKDEILSAVAALQHSRTEQAVFEQLQRQEASGGAARVEKLQEEVNQLKALEKSQQKEYGDLRIEIRRQKLSKR